MSFVYVEPRSRIARRYLSDRVKHLATMNKPAQRAYLIGQVAAAQDLPITSSLDGPDAFDKSLVVTTLRRWLEEVSEKAVA